MLPKKFRLGKKEIERLNKKGNFFRQDFLLAKIISNRTNHSRFATIISSKISKKATSRNRLKRKTFALLENIINSIAIGNYDISLCFKSLPKEEEIKPVMERLFGKMIKS